jgi:hypothetical protein
MAFTVRTGAFGSGTTSATAAVPTAGNAPVSGDLMLIQCESSNSTTAAGTPSTPAGWTKISENTGNAGATGVTTHTIFAKIAGASEANVTVSGVTDHIVCQMIVVSGHGVLDVSTDLVVGANATGATTAGSNSQSITVPAGSAVFVMVGVTTDANTTAGFSGWTNANLAGLTEIIDQGVSTAAGGGIGTAWGTCAGTTVGTTTWTGSAASRYDSVHIGVRPPGLAPPFDSRNRRRPHVRVL